MISATLTDVPPHQQSYSRFLTSIGSWPGGDSIRQDQPLARVQNFGQIEEVIVANRLGPHPTDAEDVNHINEAFVKWSGIALTALAERQARMSSETRMLVLFPSYRLLERVWLALPHLHARINRTRRGSNLRKGIATYAATAHGIWFGVEMEGVNFIDPLTHRTLADLMVLVRLPQPPSDDIRIARLGDLFGDTAAAQRSAEWVALREANNSAYRKTVHAIARGVRSPTDVIKLLMILDIRFPVPHHVANTRRIARSAGDASKIFAKFDTCLDSYDVQRWTQVNLDGSFTRVL